MDTALFFTQEILEWSTTINRPMPWKGEKNPYLIWLSEIILQQTRVEQGLAYFLRFKSNYPTIHDLARASEDEVFKLWEGLGYYSRARNLHATAKYISQELNGEFPTTYKEILSLKGVGPYTAAAIASFAYDLPYAVVDGNVYRVLSRYFGISEAIDSTKGKKIFAQKAQNLLDSKQAGRYNQAIMDFGAIQCVPKNPVCSKCPLHQKCVAFDQQIVGALPFKEKKLKKRTRFFNYLHLEQGNTIFLEKRTKKDIWQNLYQFPLIESDHLLDNIELSKTTLWGDLFGDTPISIMSASKVWKQTLSHQKINAVFWKIQLPAHFEQKKIPYIPVDKENITSFAFPKIIDWYLSDNSLLLLAF